MEAPADTFLFTWLVSSSDNLKKTSSSVYQCTEQTTHSGADNGYIYSKNCIYATYILGKIAIKLRFNSALVMCYYQGRRQEGLDSSGWKCERQSHIALMLNHQ